MRREDLEMDNLERGGSPFQSRRRHRSEVVVKLTWHGGGTKTFWRYQTTTKEGAPFIFTGYHTIKKKIERDPTVPQSVCRTPTPHVNVCDL